MGTSKPHLIALSAAAVLLGVVAMWARQPAFFSEPRFWAEEGRVFFARAWPTPWWEMLVSAPLLYFSFYTNVAVVLATFVPLEQAPLVTTLAALLAQTAPLVVLAVAIAPEWRDERRYVAMAIVLFASLTDEIWLTTLHSHYYFAVVAFLILLEPGDIGRSRAILDAALVGLAALAGPVPCFLAPLFAWKAYRSSRRADVWQAAAVVGATLVQAGFVFADLHARQLPIENLVTRGRQREDAMGGLALAIVPCIGWMKTIVLPTLGVDIANAFGDACESIGRGTSVVAGAVFGATLSGLAALVVRWLALGVPSRVRWPVAASFALIATFSIILSTGDKRILLESASGSSRYAYVPAVILLVLLLHNVRFVRRERPSPRAVVSTVLLAVALVGGVARYPTGMRWQHDWPRWRDQVAAWRRNPDHALRIWPPGWMLRLSDER